MRPPPPTHPSAMSRRDRSWRTLARTSTRPCRLPSGCWPSANCRRFLNPPDVLPHGPIKRVPIRLTT
eukprot:3529245-Prorocentrum_lima.AAC.1